MIEAVPNRLTSFVPWRSIAAASVALNREENMVDLDKMVEVAHPEQPHCAVVLVLDVSGSMASNDKIGQLNQGLKFFRDDVMADDLARKRVDLAVVTFGLKVAVDHDFSSVEAFEPPSLTADGLTPMGEALLKAMEMVETRKQIYKDNGTDYYRPWIFLITDGAPTDMEPGKELWDRVITRLHGGEKDKKFLAFVVGVEPADMTMLARIAPPQRPPVQLKAGKFKEMFQWLSKSQSKVSASRVGEQVALDSPLGWGSI